MHNQLFISNMNFNECSGFQPVQYLSPEDNHTD